MKKDWFDRDLWGNMGIWTDGWRGASIEVSITDKTWDHSWRCCVCRAWGPHFAAPSIPLNPGPFGEGYLLRIARMGKRRPEWT